MRKLASIKTIRSIIPIPEKDRIELAMVDGWQVIVKKGEFTVGSQCVYCEIDSIMPQTKEFEFLRSKNYRIKTLKMAGVISQGICFPLSILPPGDYKPEQDVTSIIGVKQYEETMDKEDSNVVCKPATKAKYPQWLMRFEWFRQMAYKQNHREGKGFPSFISKTDEIRIQNIPSILSDKSKYVVTEKIDGQSGSFCLVKRKRKFSFLPSKYEYIVCSRNLRLYSKNSSSYWQVSDKYNIENALHQLIDKDEWMAIQGECIAPGVQGNKYKVTEPDLYVFNVIKPTGRLGSIEAKAICESVGLKFVPILDKDFILPNSVEEMLNYAHARSEIGETLREGVVIRSQDGRKSFKAVDPLFLLKYDE